ncbi:ABC transporter ATP-binding protein [Luteimonas sp. MC1750]|uniref:ABC transporter ATP-binding protein n=1 Tax=Luteimonas sp. MC1750 TaxID=2799326 RepID=UPI0018F0EC46|nr:ABC transporter ATP-binding protein [Luteimonas sp. MC1750]MBJ6984850.1 ABC transporter ATP-binding protein [Luteimonas sp. MC1750]QQO07056.1 ABC transporter ATP-binding protein [Luteimonas sp. MC1750]
MTEALLDITGIRVGYPAPEGGTRVVVDALSLALGAGEIGCLLGASGCGKTTVLRAVAGFEPVLDGSIDVQGRRVAAPGLSLPPEQRSVGMMFQDYALFPHMDAAANIAFGLRGRARVEQRARVAEMLSLVGLGDRGGAYPHELSGGQQQRVALARALAPGPALLLLDEPFSNLDTDTRQQLAAELRGLLKASGATVLMVTHDQSEAFTMADRIGVMDRGRILQWDCAEALYRRPLDRFVAGFIGRGTLVPASAVGLGRRGEVLLRPHALRPDPEGPVAAELVALSFRGPGHVIGLRLGGGAVVEVDLEDADVAALRALAPGAPLRLRLAEDALVGFD